MLGLGNNLARGGVLGFSNTYSLEFDGTDEYVAIADTANLRFDAADADFSISAWVKLVAPTDGGEQVIINKVDAINDGWRFLVLDDYIGGNVNATTAGYVLHGITDTGWHHYAMTVDRNSEGKVYVDAILKNTRSISAESMATTGEIKIGYKGYGTGQPLNGNIDEVAIWNTALSAGSISNIYNNGVPTDLLADSNSANLQGWWRMGDGRLDSFNLIADQVNPTLGSEVLGDPEFNTDVSEGVTGTYWGLQSGAGEYYIADGSLNCESTEGGLNCSAQSAPVVAGKLYKIVFTISGHSTGGVLPYVGGTAGTTTSYDGTHTQYIVATNTSAFKFNTQSTPTLKVDNVSVKQVNGNPGLMTNMDAVDIVKDTP